VRELMHSLGRKRMVVLGHDIGLMVAYAYAACCPDKVSKAILMAAFPPRVGE